MRRPRDRVELFHENRRDLSKQSNSLGPEGYLRIISRLNENAPKAYEEPLTQLRLIAGKRAELADGVPLIGLSIATSPA